MSCLKEEHVDILVLQLYVLTFYQMAAALDPRLSPDAQAPNEIDFHRLRIFLDEHFSSLPDTTVTISPNAESTVPFVLTSWTIGFALPCSEIGLAVPPTTRSSYYVTTKSYGFPEHGSAEHSNVPYVTMGAVPCPVPFRTVHTHMPAISPALNR